MNQLNPPSRDLIAELALALYDAERRGVPVAPLVARYPDLRPEDAYAVQAEYGHLRLAAGAVLIGRKIGATSKAIQEMFNVRSPDFGLLFDDMAIPNGGTVAVGDLIHPLVEPEIAFRLAKPLRGAGVNVADVLAATESVAPALEVIDSRIRNWRISFVDTIADNGSSARFVIGPELDVGFASTLDQRTVHLFRDDELVQQAQGSEVLGHPAAAVAWLANSIGAYGDHLRAGDIVLSGSFTTAEPLVHGSRYRADFVGMGEVSLTGAQ